MIPWIQVYANIITHDKTYALAEALHIKNYAAVGIMVSLWSWAAINATNGDISSYPPRAISDAVGWNGKRPEDFYQTLLEVRLIERADNRVVVRNWEKYAQLLIDSEAIQKEKAAERVKKHRERKRSSNVTCNADCNVTVTPCNAPTVPNLTVPNLTVINSGGGERNTHAKENEDSVENPVDNSACSLDQYLGMNDAVKAELNRIAEHVLQHTPGEQDLVRVLECVMTQTQSETGDWQIVLDPNRVKLMQYAFEQAEIAGKRGSWKYAQGVLENLHRRGIQTLAEAAEYDENRRDKLC